MVARVYKSSQEIDHDLFKLTLAKMKKNVSYNEEAPDYEDVEHVHFFHTVDSNGKAQTMSNAVGGHFHEVEVVHNTKGGLPTLKISAPLKWVRERVRGKNVRVARPLPEDNHRHGMLYLGSQKIKPRQASMEFAKFESALRQKQEAPVEGVLDGG